MWHIVSFSGGADSTYLCFYLIENGYPLDEAVMFDAGWEFPQMYAHIEKMRAYLEHHGVRFTVIKPSKSFDYLMFEKEVHEKNGEIHYGYSWCGSFGCRWGTTEKIKALDTYAKSKKDAIVYVGIAADEMHRLEKERKPFKRFPLVENGIIESDCLIGCYEHGYDWGGLYEQLDRVSCMYCGQKNLKELRNIYFHMPDVWQGLRERQSKTERPYKGEGKSVFQLEARFEFEKERLAEGLSITNKEFFSLLANRLKEVRL